MRRRYRNARPAFFDALTNTTSCWVNIKVKSRRPETQKERPPHVDTPGPESIPVSLEELFFTPHHLLLAA